jgi:hypothetical protein
LPSDKKLKNWISPELQSDGLSRKSGVVREFCAYLGTRLGPSSIEKTYLERAARPMKAGTTYSGPEERKTDADETK